MKKGLLLSLFMLTFSGEAFANERAFHVVEWDIRTLPVLGFFPLGGNLRISNTQISTYALGPGIDLFNFTDHQNEQRLTVINFSTYLVGLNYNALLNSSENLSVFSLAYFRVGPHYRFRGLYKGISFGSQLGYGMVVEGNTEEGQSRYLHGLDVSFTMSFTPARELSGRSSYY